MVFDITADKVRAEIGRVVTRGPEAVVARSLPLTPRARRAIEHARQEAFLMNEPCIGPEHLFLGLVSEPAGVACQVLLNLGVRPTDLRKEVFKVRIAQMKFVERAIRPVRASTLRKRKMREELLAHFVATYDQALRGCMTRSRIESSCRTFRRSRRSSSGAAKFAARSRTSEPFCRAIPRVPRPRIGSSLFISYGEAHVRRSRCDP